MINGKKITATEAGDGLSDEEQLLIGLFRILPEGHKDPYRGMRE